MSETATFIRCINDHMRDRPIAGFDDIQIAAFAGLAQAFIPALGIKARSEGAKSLCLLPMYELAILIGIWYPSASMFV